MYAEHVLILELLDAKCVKINLINFSAPVGGLGEFKEHVNKLCR